MNRIYATSLVSSTDPQTFQKELDKAILTWEATGWNVDIEVQFSTAKVGQLGDGTRYSALLVVRKTPSE